TGGDGNDVFSQGIGYGASDVIDAGAGDDTIRLNLYGYNAAAPVNVDVTLGSGADTIQFDYTYSVSQAQVTVSDFNTAEDTVDLNYMLNNQFSGWDGSTNPFADAALDPNGGFLQLVQVGSDVVLSVDMNGGGDSFSTLIVFENSLVGDFSEANFNPAYPPDGTVPAGILVNGTAASETLNGTIGADTLNGLDGNDYLWGGASPDTLDGGNGSDQLHGEAGDDLLFGGDGNDYLYGEDGDDVMNGGAGYDNLQGGDGDDLMDGGDGGGTLNGGNGGDTMIGGTGTDYFYAGYDFAVDVMTGGDGNDVFSQGIGYGASDVIDAGAGDDTIRLNLYGYNAAAPVNVDITLGSGADTILFDYTYSLNYAQATISDFDTTEDTVDLDYLLNNQISGWDGVSNPFGSGYMRLVQDGADTVLEIDLNGNGDGFQTALVFSNTNVEDFTDQNFLIDPVTSQGYNPDGSGVFGSTISGTAIGETLDGTFGDDLLSGLGGADTLNGGNGADDLSGGDGADQLTGGFGNDTMSGGADADSFVFAPGGGDDVITDFSVGDDILSLQSGLSITSLSDVDTNADLSNDALLVLFSDDSSVLLEGVTGITDPNDLLF
ncbi:calcium-binding protein, partial [Shimia sp.]|uniref:calcium-binding protein n=1 Tax=Shimia sp. TaxID=1954381 RepID=UPI003563DE31